MEGDQFLGRTTCTTWRGDGLYFEGIADDAVSYDNLGWARIDTARVADLSLAGTRDPNHVARTWVVTLAFLLTDYRYLYF